MRQRWFITIITVTIIIFTHGVSQATNDSVPIPVASGPFQCVSGTVTVRLDGVLVQAQSVNYVIIPNFKSNTGVLANTEWGTYFLRADNVPMDQNYALSITAFYNSTINGQDGQAEQKGKSYTGTIKIDIPYHRDVDFGVRFIDLK